MFLQFIETGNKYVEYQRFISCHCEFMEWKIDSLLIEPNQLDVISDKRKFDK